MEPKSTQTDGFTFTGNSTMADEALRFALALGQKRDRSTPPKDKPRSKRRKVSAQADCVAVVEQSKATEDEPQRESGAGSGTIEKSDGSKQEGNKGAKEKSDGPKQDGSKGKSKGKKDQKGAPPKPPEKKAPKSSSARGRTKGEALIIKTEASKYADVLKMMRADERLAEMGSNVRSIRRTRTGEMLLVLKRGAKDQGPAYQRLAAEVVGNGVQVKSLGSTTTIQIKDLDEVTEVTEIVTALSVECQIEVPPQAITLRKGVSCTQVAIIKLSAVDARKAVATGKVRVGWSVCPVSIPRPITACFRCFGQGHLARDCKNTDRSKLCRRCGAEGHKAQSCQEPMRCTVCVEKGKSNTKHMAGGPRCPGVKSKAQPCSK